MTVMDLNHILWPSFDKSGAISDGKKDWIEKLKDIMINRLFMCKEKLVLSMKKNVQRINLLLTETNEDSVAEESLTVEEIEDLFCNKDDYNFL